MAMMSCEFCEDEILTEANSYAQISTPKGHRLACLSCAALHFQGKSTSANKHEGAFNELESWVREEKAAYGTGEKMIYGDHGEAGHGEHVMGQVLDKIKKLRSV